LTFLFSSTHLLYYSNRKSTVVQLISLLVRLNAGPAARTTFLAARTEITHRYIRVIRFEGHIGMYIADLSMVVFTGIKHTADWFLASFRENEVASCKLVIFSFCLQTADPARRFYRLGKVSDRELLYDVQNASLRE
jgi:hypothetical protein